MFSTRNMTNIVPDSHGKRNVLPWSGDFLCNMNSAIGATISISFTAISRSKSTVLLSSTYRAFPIPIIHAVPGLQPLVPSLGSVMKEPGCVCFLSPSKRQKTTRKPETERKSVACVNLGTDFGARKRGPAVFIISYFVCFELGKE